MSRYAVVVIVEADDDEAAFQDVAGRTTDEVKYIGAPWSVPHSDSDPVYGVTSIRVSIDGQPVELWPA